jgi:long-chain fatty acid transport protein
MTNHLTKSKLSITISLAFALLSSSAFATDGYFSHGYGVQSQGMGGVAIALPQDALVAASNPAAIAFLADRVDLGLQWFQPIRDAEITNAVAPFLPNGKYDGNEAKNFFIPELGYVKHLNKDFTFGFAIYGNGGMNTDYNRPIFGSSRAGVDLAQVFFAPTLAWQITPQQSVGVKLNVAYQRFEAKGLQAFEGFSTAPNNVTNKGHDNAHGAGLQIGWMGQITDELSAGATYQSKTYMTKFDRYKGLFAEQGDFDIPATYGLGLAYKPTSSLTFALDYQRILYSDVASVGNSIQRFFAPDYSGLLGANGGAGFGWKDVSVVKVGASYAVTPEFTLRAGYNHSTQPIPKNEALFNVLAPGVVQDHVSLGSTWKVNAQSELSVSYTHAFENTVHGKIPAQLYGGDVNLRMYQNSLGIAYSWNL